jgi:hypothetical protein
MLVWQGYLIGTSRSPNHLAVYYSQLDCSLCVPVSESTDGEACSVELRATKPRLPTGTNLLMRIRVLRVRAST